MSGYVQHPSEQAECSVRNQERCKHQVLYVESQRVCHLKPRTIREPGSLSQRRTPVGTTCLLWESQMPESAGQTTLDVNRSSLGDPSLNTHPGLSTWPSDRLRIPSVTEGNAL
jgi:hypothetical protein